jgi:hypothetical protein
MSPDEKERDTDVKFNNRAIQCSINNNWFAFDSIGTQPGVQHVGAVRAC